MRRPNLIHSIQEHEGTVKEDGRHKPYDDADDDLNDVIGKEGDIEGDCTLAGRNLTVTGLSDDEVMYLLKNDVKRLENVLRQEFTFWRDLNKARQNVLIEMAYHMGYGNLMTFENMIKALQNDDYLQAGNEILDSGYGSEFPERAYNLAERMKDGVPYSNND